jgi:hypothetical protein
MFQQKVQSMFSGLDREAGQKMMRAVLFVVFMIAVFALYARSQFRGLKDAEAMEYAQVGRNLAQGQGFTTACVRPIDLWYVEKNTERKYPVTEYPDIRHAPVFPFVLSMGYRILRPSFEPPVKSGVFQAEKLVVVPLCVLFALATGLLVFCMGRRLFNERVAYVGVLIYLLSEAVLARAVSGLPTTLVTFLATLMLYLLVVSERRREKQQPGRRWLLFTGTASVVCALAFLTRYGAVVLVVPAALFLWLSFDSGRWRVIAAFVLIFVILVSPWLVRNGNVSGGVFGTAPYSALHDSSIYAGNSFDRQMAPSLDRARIARSMKARFLEGLSKGIDVDVRTLGTGLIACFFIVSFFHRFGDGTVNRLRWCVAAGLAAVMCAEAVWGKNSGSLLTVFLPVAVVYGTAYFFVILDRLEFVEAGWDTVLTWMMILLTALPGILTVLGPRATVPYPPYFPPFVSRVCGSLQEDEVICTDIPWATAWYGRRSSVLVPETVDDFLEMSRTKVRVGGLYLTSETVRSISECGSRYRSGRAWLPILAGRIPEDFHLKHGFVLSPGAHDQIFLTDRVRW